MHVAEGVLSPAVLGGGAILAVIGLAIGIRKMRSQQIPMCGVMAAAFFIASLIHVPIGVTNAHLLLIGLTGIVLGWGAFPAIFAALFLQAILFQYGGLTTLGVNTACMGWGAICSWKIYRLFSAKTINPAWLRIGAFLGGALGVAFSAVFTSFALGFSHEGFRTAAYMLLLSHLPIMAVEGIITMFTADFIRHYRPEIFNLELGRSR